jgi:hypothetical protein
LFAGLVDELCVAGVALSVHVLLDLAPTRLPAFFAH